MQDLCFINVKVKCCFDDISTSIDNKKPANAGFLLGIALIVSLNVTLPEKVYQCIAG
jgi:hypothetical protein